MTVTKFDLDREERRQRQAEIAESLRESGALDEIFARIDAGEPLTGHAGLLQGMLKATLERGLGTELRRMDRDAVRHCARGPRAREYQPRIPTRRARVRAE